MRILRVAQNFDGHVFPLSRDQAAMGHDVTVLRPAEDDERVGVLEQDGYTLVRYPETFEVVGNRFSVKLGNHLRQATEYDVVHAHSHLFFSTNLSAMKRFFGEAPLAITNHGVHSQSVPEWFSKAYMRTLGRWTYNRADVVFCYTDFDKSRLQKYGVNSNFEVISNGIDVTKFTPKGPLSDLVDHDEPAVLFAGRLSEGKRPWDALEAIALVRESGIDVDLYVCGEGPLRENLEIQADDLGIADSVHFLGRVPSGEMPKIYRSVDALILTSRAEGVPRVVLESLACETPVITSALPQLIDFVGEAGYTADVGDIERFAERLGTLLQNPEEKKRFEKRGRTIVEERFRWENLATKTTLALERLTD